MSQLKIYNSLSKTKEPFTPIHEDRVGMYVCGPTVYSNVHLGNIRTFMSFDVIYRYLEYLGYKVRYVRNITDVGHLVGDLDEGEDKIAERAKLENLEPMEVVQKYTNGSYGSLSGRVLEELYTETRDLKNQSEKSHPADFAIWMKADDRHLMKWNSKWSLGFPGWHLECSAMSTKYLGKEFDIHGGGNDLKFPHHENEVAQNIGACGCAPARYWLHANMLLMNGRKMSKSDGNTISAEDLFSGTSPHVSKGYSPMVVRFFMLQAHYRSTLDLSDQALEAAEKGYKKLMEAKRYLDDLKHEAPSQLSDTDQQINSLFMLS